MLLQGHIAGELQSWGSDQRRPHPQSGPRSSPLPFQTAKDWQSRDLGPNVALDQRPCNSAEPLLSVRPGSASPLLSHGKMVAGSLRGPSNSYVLPFIPSVEACSDQRTRSC